jgi:hypothetical protein
MAYLVNKDFAELAADGSNYLTCTMDVKIMLTGFNNTIEEPNTTLYFLGHHLT